MDRSPSAGWIAESARTRASRAGSAYDSAAAECLRLRAAGVKAREAAHAMLCRVLSDAGAERAMAALRGWRLRVAAAAELRERLASMAAELLAVHAPCHPDGSTVAARAARRRWLRGGLVAVAHARGGGTARSPAPYNAWDMTHAAELAVLVLRAWRSFARARTMQVWRRSLARTWFQEFVRR